MLKLFGGSRTRASMPRWYMEEKSIDYELVELNLESKQHRNAEFLCINQFGKLPALIDDNVLLFLCLARLRPERFIQSKIVLFPKLNTSDRPRFARITVFVRCC